MNPRAVEGRHALYAGWVAGMAHRAGLDVVPIVDRYGNYTDHIGVVLHGVRPRNAIAVNVYLVVGEPPDDWHLDDLDALALADLLPSEVLQL